MIRKFGGTTGVDSQPDGVDIGFGGGSNIKSIQRGYFSMSASSQNVTISEIDLNSSILFVMARYFTNTFSLDSTVSQMAVMGNILNATTINFQKIGSGTSINVTWQVIEFKNVKSVQKGFSDFARDGINEYGNVTISAIDTAKSIIVSSFSYIGNDAYLSCFSNYKILNATTIQLGRAPSITNARNYWHWQVIEFK